MIFKIFDIRQIKTLIPERWGKNNLYSYSQKEFAGYIRRGEFGWGTQGRESRWNTQTGESRWGTAIFQN